MIFVERDLLTESFNDCMNFVKENEESIALESTQLTLVQELCYDFPGDERYEQLQEASIKGILSTIKAFFKLIIAKIIEFFRNLGHTGTKIKKDVHNFLESNKDKLSSVTGTLEGSVKYFDDFAFMDYVDKEMNSMASGVEKAMGTLEKASKPLDENERDEIAKYFDIFDSTGEDLIRSLREKVFKTSESLDSAKALAVLKFIDSDKFQSIINSDKKLLSGVRRLELAITRAYNKGSNIPLIGDFMAEAKKQVNLLFKTMITMYRVIMSEIISSAQSCKSALLKAMGENK